MSGYHKRREPRHGTVRVRGLDLHVRRWGPEPATGEVPVLLLHGWLDTGDTFQFLADAFEADLPLIAPDWRGFGRSAWAPDGYWFADYLADLDALLDELARGRPARLIGHSMGGNVASLYAGLRPARVHSLVNLEGFGLPRTAPEQAPARLRQWLDQLKAPVALKTYDSFDQLAAAIRFRYPRVGEVKADFIAHAWAGLAADGRVHLHGDARHRWVNPVLYKREDAEACWRGIEAPLLMLLGQKSEYLDRLGADGTDAAFRALIPHIDIQRIEGAGHMLHIEQPEKVARLIEDFWRRFPGIKAIG
jgi:pimeloyl-ACP methyl ester carboxylesterase